MAIRAFKTTITGLSLCLLAAQAATAASTNNMHVAVSSNTPGVQAITVNGNHFDIFAPGQDDDFTATVDVAPVDGWTLVKPEASELPLEMKVGGGAGYEVERDEDEGSGSIALNNYYIKSNQDDGAKVIEVPTGKSVTYTAYRNGKERESKWIVQGTAQWTAPDGGGMKTLPVRAQKSGVSKIIFNRSFWNVDEWFIPALDTPKAGKYAIIAEDMQEPILKDMGEMTVFGVDFVKNGDYQGGGHEYGFDDYTNWKSYAPQKEYDYYGSQLGRCMWPYASVSVDDHGHSALAVLSSDGKRTFNLVSDTQRMTYLPTTTKTSTPVDFNVDVRWYNLAGEALLTAECEGAKAQLRVVPFSLQTRSLLVIFVGGATNHMANFSAGIGNVNRVFKQAVTEFTIIEREFPYNNGPSDNHVWTKNDRTAVQSAAFGDPDLSGLISDSEHVVFIVHGTDSQGFGGWGENPGKFAWIYHSQTHPSIIPHEIAHHFGVGDEYTPGPTNATSTPGPDKDNLMNFPRTPNLDRLRYHQWKKINR